MNLPVIAFKCFSTLQILKITFFGEYVLVNYIFSDLSTALSDYTLILLLRRLTYKRSSEARNGEVTNPK